MPLTSNRFLNLVDATTLYTVMKAVKVHIKAENGGTVAEAHDQVIYLVEGTKEMTALLLFLKSFSLLPLI